MRVLGIDPGLRRTGWGVIVAEGNRLSHVAHGVIRTDQRQELAQRLHYLLGALSDLLGRFAPDEVAVEETLANQNPTSTLKLGMARGVALLAPAAAGLPVAQYLPMIVKKAVVGTGHADKAQVAMMVGRLLPGALAEADAADALAVAICHSHHRQTLSVWGVNKRPTQPPSLPSPAARERGAAVEASAKSPLSRAAGESGRGGLGRSRKVRVR